MTESRISIKLTNPNPLFEQWITEWRDQENPHHIKQISFYNTALDSLKKFPLILQTGSDCLILKGFSKKLCLMLDKRLECHKNGTVLTTKKRRSQCVEYCPGPGTGPYAIILTLYKHAKEDGKKFMLKDEIIRLGQHLCEKSFTRPDPGSFYTAWSSMTTLINKELIIKTGNPAKFSLTDKGIALAIKLYERSLEKDLEEKENVQKKSPLKMDIKIPKEKQIKKMNLEKQSSSNSIGSNSEKSDSQRTNSQKSNSQKICSQTSSTFNDFLLAPNSFKVFLIVDQQETSGCPANKKAVYDEIILELNSLSVPYEIRHIKIGDYAWMCKGQGNGEELMLPYIAERKRMDDFGASIKDGRFHEQKFRLKQCGLDNLIYLVESYADNKHVGLPLSSIFQAATNTLLQDDFSVKFTENIRATAHYLATFTQLLTKMFLNKTLASCPKSHLVKVDLNDDLVGLMTFGEFNQGASKNKPLKVKELFIRQLLQLKGISVDRAIAISDKYATPRLLMDAYNQCSGDREKETLLSDIKYGNFLKKIGPVISKTIFQFYSFKKY